MIWDSQYWKNDLLRSAKRLRWKKRYRRWTEKRLAKLEQQLMLGFYSIRKLAEAGKLSDSIVKQDIKIPAAPWRGRPVHQFNWDKYPELYDLNATTLVSKDLIYLSNQVIHSFVFVIETHENGQLDCFFIASDRTRQKELLCLSVDQVIQLFEQVGANYPSRGLNTWDDKSGKYQVSQE
jgi:hypothetical protein